MKCLQCNNDTGTRDWKFCSQECESEYNPIPTRAELLTGLKAAMAAIEYACAEAAPHAADKIRAHVNGFPGSPDIRELVKQLESS